MLQKPLKLEVTLKAARGLPQRMADGTQFKSLYVAFRFFAVDDVIKSPRVPFKTINPRIDHCHVITETVSQAFIDFASSAALVFEVCEWKSDQPATLAPLHV